MEHGYDRDALRKRLHRIEGQVPGLERMVEGDRLEILEDHVTHCVHHALASGDVKTATQKSEELLAAVERFARVR